MRKSKALRAVLMTVVVLVVAVLGLAAFVAVPFLRAAPPADGAKLPGGAILVVAGGSNVYIFPESRGHVVLVDCGGDPKMTAVAAALKKSGLGLNAVEAVLITHAHPDHIAGCAAVPKAEFYSLGAEQAYVEGSAVEPNPITALTSPAPKSTGIKIAHGLEDGEAGHLGNLQIVAFLVAGHTPGSGAYLINNVLYAGDAVAFTRGGAALNSPWIFNTNGTQAQASIKALAKRLSADRVQLVATGHSAPGPLSALQ